MNRKLNKNIVLHSTGTITISQDIVNQIIEIKKERYKTNYRSKRIYDSISYQPDKLANTDSLKEYVFERMYKVCKKYKELGSSSNNIFIDLETPLSVFTQAISLNIESGYGNKKSSIVEHSVISFISVINDYMQFPNFEKEIIFYKKKKMSNGYPINKITKEDELIDYIAKNKVKFYPLFANCEFIQYNQDKEDIIKYIKAIL